MAQAFNESYRHKPTPEDMQNALIENNRQLFNMVIKAAQDGKMLSRWMRYMISEWFEFYRKLI